MRYKIGQIIEFTKGFVITTEKEGKVNVKAGDKARVIKKINDATGEIVYITGDAKGKSQYVKIEVDDSLDEDDIAKKILKELNE